MSDITVARKNYWSLDVAKFICSILIITAHFASEQASFPKVVDYVFSLYIIAVPFFFCCSGFLFFNKWMYLNKEGKKEYFLKYQKRIWTMYGCWSAVYVPFSVVSWIKNGTFNIGTVAKWAHRALVITTYPTIWFLPALATAVAVTCLLITKLSRKNIIILCVMLYFFGMLGYTYNFAIQDMFLGKIMDIYLMLFTTSRNGLFNGVPFVFMGCYFASHNNNDNDNKKINQFKNFALSVVFLVCVTAESLFLKIKYNVSGMDIGVFLVPFIFTFFKFVLSLDFKENKLWMWCRKLSLLIFVSQRLFLSALPVILPSLFKSIYSNDYVGIIAVLVLTISFSLIMITLSEKIRILKKFI